MYVKMMDYGWNCGDGLLVLVKRYAATNRDSPNICIWYSPETLGISIYIQHPRMSHYNLLPASRHEYETVLLNACKCLILL